MRHVGGKAQPFYQTNQDSQDNLLYPFFRTYPQGHVQTHTQPTDGTLNMARCDWIDHGAALAEPGTPSRGFVSRLLFTQKAPPVRGDAFCVGS